MKARKQAQLSAFFFVHLAGLAAPASAMYLHCGGQFVRWNTTGFDVTFRFFESSSTRRTRFFDALQSWDDLVGSELDLTLSATVGGDTMYNGINEAYFTDISNPEDVLAEALVDYTNVAGCAAEPCCINPSTAPSILEADIRFYDVDVSNNLYNWLYILPQNLVNVNGFPSSANPYFAVVAAHELGHAVGLQHNANQVSRLGDGYPSNGGWLHPAISDTSSNYERLRPFAQDQAEIRLVYPGSGSGSRIYSSNSQTSTSSGDAMPLSYNPTGNNQTFYPSPSAAAVGSTVAIRICYGNAGNAAYSTAIPIQVYLSNNNDRIDTADTQATTTAQFGSGLNANTTSCAPINFVVPNVLTGQYNIIYRLDIGVGTSRRQEMVVNRRLTVF